MRELSLAEQRYQAALAVIAEGTVTEVADPVACAWSALIAEVLDEP